MRLQIVVSNMKKIVSILMSTTISFSYNIFTSSRGYCCRFGDKSILKSEVEQQYLQLRHLISPMIISDVK